MRNPDIKSVRASVWKGVPSPASVAASPAARGHYVIHAPGSHLIWPWKLLTMVSLSELPGVEPAVKHFPQAAYEIVLFALNPDHCPPADPDDGPWHYLMPPDVIQQFPDVGLQRMTLVLDTLVTDVLTGILIPDSDFRSRWERRMNELAYGTVAGNA